MAVDHDIIIAGGGLNGPALALALAQAGLSVAVIDARPLRDRAQQGFDGRAYALALASRRLLTALGLWGGLADKAQAILRVEAAQGQPGEGAGPFHLVFDSAEIEEGPVGHMLEDRFLYAALVDAMAEDADDAAALSRYARARRPEAMARLIGIDALNRASMMSARPLRDLRAAALWGLYALAPVRRTMMRAGLGLR